LIITGGDVLDQFSGIHPRTVQAFFVPFMHLLPKIRGQDMELLPLSERRAVDGGF